MTEQLYEKHEGCEPQDRARELFQIFKAMFFEAVIVIHEKHD